MNVVDCIFCKIALGEISTKTIYEDDDFRIFLDVSPATKGHALIVPKEHFEDIYHMPEGIAGKIFLLAQKTAITLKEQLSCQGLNVIQNNGAVAGQTVFHFHMHLIPRYEDDQQKIGWNPREITQEQLEVVKKLITE